MKWTLITTADNTAWAEHWCDEFLSGALLCPSQLHQGKMDCGVRMLHINTTQEQPVSCSNTLGDKRLLLPDNQINQGALGNRKIIVLGSKSYVDKSGKITR